MCANGTLPVSLVTKRETEGRTSELLSMQKKKVINNKTAQNLNNWSSAYNASTVTTEC